MSDEVVRVRTDAGDTWIYHNVAVGRVGALKNSEVLDDEPTHKHGRSLGEVRVSKRSGRPAKPKTTAGDSAGGKQAASSAKTAEEKA